MSKPIQTGGPAFPRDSSSFQTGTNGMTLRDYFAAKAMESILANPASYDSGGFWRQEDQSVAEMAYGIADDMLKERNKTK